MIVVDTNVIGNLYLTSQRSALAEHALRTDPEWTAPILWRSEMRNVLALYVQRSLLTLEDAQQIMGAASDLLRGHEYQVVSDDVLRLAAESGCSAYDCEFVSLARELGVLLVTADRQLLQAFPGTAVGLEAFCGQR